MRKSIMITSLAIVLLLAHTSQIKSHDQYEQAKKMVQEKTHELTTQHPLEYQAIKTGAGYGMLFGGLKGFIPLMPKRGRGPISCACIGAITGASAFLLMHRHASDIMQAKNKLASLLQEDLVSKALQVMQGAQKTEPAHETAVFPLSDEEKAAQKIAKSEENKAVAAQYSALIRATGIATIILFA